MTKLSIIEVLVSMLLTTFRLQVQILGAMRGNPARPYAIHRLRQLIQGLLASIDEFEIMLKMEIEQGAEFVLGESATLLSVISDMKSEGVDLPILDRLSKIVQRGHGGITERLTEIEEEEIGLLEKRFAKIKEDVTAVLHDLD